MGIVKKKIAIVLSTGGLENDDRIRKEALYFQNKNYQVTIFAQVPENKATSGYTSYGIAYRLLYLKTRDIFPSGKFLLFKTIEMFLKIIKELNRFDTIWCADEGMFLFPLLLKGKTIVWDLHEIPQFFLRNNLTKKLFKFIEKRCLFIIHANQYRLNYLIENDAVADTKKHICIRNYPDENFISSQLLPSAYNEIKTWLNGSKYVYLQGISAQSRYPYNSIAAVLKASDLKVIVTAGMISNDIKVKLIEEFGKTFDEKVYFTGMLDQLYTPSIIRDAYFSMVFYQANSANNRYCEANRFYQPLVFGVPVICGCNEPLKEIIQNFQCGLSLHSDGENINEIINAINYMLINHELFRENTIKVKNNFIWTDDYVANSLQHLL